MEMMIVILTVTSINLWSLKPLEQTFQFPTRPACLKALKKVRTVNYKILKKECK